ncbi:hypothetical protein [Kitasatospora sp. NBC_01302]|uniref:hypothetical protein n=1 Tax=Kitasatospora sp. NBC_01302 TaxID=2903575 RepID=UPI002E1614A4|nr:hypothetical protein OG294_24810 [Kitasatospora sp. NBC_01302]
MPNTHVRTPVAPPDNVVRCVECNGPIRHPEGKPYECVDCGRGIYGSDGLVRPGYYWEITDAGWLTSVEYDEDEDEYDRLEEEFLGW